MLFLFYSLDFRQKIVWFYLPSSYFSLSY
jgi:hypothetical protein